jgi:hypothetical protein
MTPFPWRAAVEVRPDGSVWRVARSGRQIAPKRIDMPDGSKGYRNVRLPDESGRWRTFKAHRLVWWWHHGPVPDGLQIDHIDGDKSNNRIENLRVVTQAENITASYGAGRTRPWSRTGTVSDRAARAIALREAGASLKDIAADLGCSISHAHRLASRG